MNRAAVLCARSEHAMADIRAKLMEWGLNGSEAQEVLQQLVRQGFIDDQRFAVAFVKDREPRAAWAAMMRFAASRGFEASIAADCVKQVTRSDVEDD